MLHFATATTLEEIILRIKRCDAIMSLGDTTFCNGNNTGGNNNSNKKVWRSNVIRGYYILKRQTTLEETIIQIKGVMQ